MNVRDLNAEQIRQLKADYYEIRHPEGVSYGELANIDALVTSEEIIRAYDGIEFVENDFIA